MKTFVEELLSHTDARNAVRTPQDAQELIDDLEDECPHDELPACYDWLVARRDYLLNMA